MTVPTNNSQIYINCLSNSDRCVLLGVILIHIAGIFRAYVFSTAYALLCRQRCGQGHVRSHQMLHA